MGVNIQSYILPLTDITVNSKVLVKKQLSADFNEQVTFSIVVL